MSRFLRVLRAGAGWAVFDEKGGRVTDVFHRFDAAKRQRARLEAGLRPAKSQIRPCMTCGDRFASEGVHNRMCGRCRALGGDMGATAGPAVRGRPVRRGVS